MFIDNFLAKIPEYVLNKKLIDVVNESRVSVRTFNCINHACDDGSMPFLTIKDYLISGSDSYRKLTKIPNLGKKSALEIDDLINNIIANSAPAESLNYTESFGHKTKSSSEYYNIDILKLIQTSKVSVRLENYITEALINNSLTFRTIGEYLEAGRNAIFEIDALPNLGKKSINEFHDLISSFVNEIKLLESGCLDHGSYHPLLKKLETITINDLLKTLNVRQKEVLELRYGLNFNSPLTLDQIGSIFEVTRERIRQIEAKALKLLRKPYSDWAKKELSQKSQELWDLASKGFGAIPIEPTYSVKNELPLEAIFLIDLAYSSFNEWLDTVSKLTPLGRISNSQNFNNVKKIHTKILSILNDSTLPIHISVLEKKLNVDKQVLQVSLHLIEGLRFYGGYISDRIIHKRLKRAFRLHSILAFKKYQGTVSLAELKELYLKNFHDDDCSMRDCLIVMTASPNLFLNCYDHGWAGLGDADNLKILLEIQNDRLNNEDVESDEPDDSNIKNASNTLIDIVKRYGPEKFEVIREHFTKLTKNKYSKASVGPILILRDDFVRVAPGVYGLINQLNEKTSYDKAVKVLLDPQQAELYCHARLAGEHFNSFPMWTPHMEYEWVKWAKELNQLNLYQSLLYIAEPSAWSIGDEEKSKWEKLKKNEGYYHFLEKNPINLIETLPSARNILSVAIVAKKNGCMNWMSANRTMGLRVDDRHVRSTLALLVALKIIYPADHWQYPHKYNSQSAELIKSIEKTIYFERSIKELMEMNLDSTNSNLGWIKQGKLHELVSAWVNSLSDIHDEETNENLMLDSLDDLIKYAQLKKAQEEIYG